MNLSSYVDPGSIRIGNRQFGPSLVAFALMAVATSGLALKKLSVEHRILFSPRLFACR
jgi:hypothetical protein